MSMAPPRNEIQPAGSEGPESPAAVKARLLAWAEDSDASQRAVRWTMDAIATGGAIAFLGVIAARRMFPLRPRRRTAGARATRAGEHGIGRALAARAAEWLHPHAVRATRTRLKGRAVR